MSSKVSGAPEHDRSDGPSPAIPSPEEKWEANRSKVTFALGFPGRLADWQDAVSKTIDAVLPVSLASGSVVLFSDGTFLITPRADAEPALVLAALAAARPRLEPRYPDAYATLDRLIARDREVTRLARLGKILGAIRQNAGDIPELKDAVQRLLNDWSAAPHAHD